MVGRRNRAGFPSRLGSVSAALAAHSSCPTAVIPATWRQGLLSADSAAVSERGRFSGQIVAAVEAGPAALSVLAVAAGMAQCHGVPLCAVTVGSDGAEREDGLWLLDLLFKIRRRHPLLPCGSCIVSGTPALGIMEAARGARLLVIGTRGVSGLPGLVRGSVSQAVLETASSPVLVVSSRAPLKVQA